MTLNQLQAKMKRDGVCLSNIHCKICSHRIKLSKQKSICDLANEKEVNNG